MSRRSNVGLLLSAVCAALLAACTAPPAAVPDVFRSELVPCVQFPAPVKVVPVSLTIPLLTTFPVTVNMPLTLSVPLFVIFFPAVPTVSVVMVSVPFKF